MRGNRTRFLVAMTAIMVVLWSSIAVGGNGDPIKAGRTTRATNKTRLRTTETGADVGLLVTLAGTTTGAAIKGVNNAAGNGIAGFSKTGAGVFGTGATFGVDSSVTAPGAVGIRSTASIDANDGIQANTANAVGDAVQGVTTGGAAFAIFAITSGGGVGVVSSSGPGTAVSASNGSATNATLTANNSTDGGTTGRFTGDTALVVRPHDTFGTGLNADMTGDTNGNGNAADDGNNAIFASSDDTNNNAVITSNTPASCDALTCEAIETFGFVDVNGNARVTGTLTKGAGAFEIDHPLDPEHYYLRHSFVESPDMKNIYDGVVTTDGGGMATVRLPAYFGALNKDFRYQLTIIGRTFAQAIVWKEIADGGRTFQIRTSEPNVKVSWQVTGIRKDAYANAHRVKVVERKTGGAAERYLHPELFGHPRATPLGLDLPTVSKAGYSATRRAEADLYALIRQKVAEALEDAARAQRAIQR